MPVVSGVTIIMLLVTWLEYRDMGDFIAHISTFSFRIFCQSCKEIAIFTLPAPKRSERGIKSRKMVGRPPSSTMIFFDPNTGFIYAKDAEAMGQEYSVIKVLFTLS